MLKCNGNSELYVKGERIQTKQQQLTSTKQKQVTKILKNNQRTSCVCERKTLQPNFVVGCFNEKIYGDLLNTIRNNSGKVEDFQRYLQTSDRKYSEIYHEFFGVHYEHLKQQIRIE